MRYLLVASCCVVLAAVAASAFAEDLVPPNWRGGPGSQTVQWEFLENPGTYPPSGGLYITPDCAIQYGWTPAFAPTLLHIPGPGAGWHEKQPTWEAVGGPIYDPNGNPGDGWINLSGEVYIHLPDVPITRPHKEIWLQIVWEPQSQGNVPGVFAGFDNVNLNQGIPLVNTSLWGPGIDPSYPFRVVNHSVYHFDLNPNPNQEWIYIRGGINIDEIIVDTQCVPEPVTLSLLGLGMVPVVWRRMRRK